MMVRRREQNPMASVYRLQFLESILNTCVEEVAAKQWKLVLKVQRRKTTEAQIHDNQPAIVERNL